MAGPGTISELIIAASVDPTGVKRGLDRATGHFRDFGRGVETELDQLGRGASLSGTHVADAILEGLNSTFRQKKILLTEALLSGNITEAQFKQQGARVAQAYNASLVDGMRLLRTQLGVTEVNGLAALERLTGAYKAEGLKAGRSYGAGVQEGMQQGVGAPNRGPGFQVGGRNAAPAVTAVAYGFESLARSASAAEGGVRAATRSVATFAAGFGPGGVVVTALIAGGLAIYEYFDRARMEAEKTTAELRKHLAGMANAGDASGIQKQGREAFFGTPFDEAGKARPVSTLVQGAFEGSLADVRAQLAAAQDQFYKETSGFRQKAIQQRIIDIKAQLAPLERDFRAVNEAARNLLSQPADNAGQLAGVTVTAKRAKPGATGFEQEAKDVRTLTTAYEQMQTLGLSPALLLHDRLAAVLRRVGDQLAAVKDQAGPAAVQLRTMQLELQKAMTSGNEAGLAGDKPFVPSQPRVDARAAIERVNLLRDTLGEFDAITMQAETGLRTVLENVTSAIEYQGGPLKASNELLAARRDLMRELADIAKGQGSELWSTEDALRLQTDLKAGLKAIGIELKENTDQWTAMRQGIQGVLDTASGLGLISASLSKIGGGAIHAIDSLKTLQKARAEGGDGMGSLTGISAMLGVVGGVVGAVSGLAQLFTQHDAALDRNTERLETLRTAMVDTRGLSGQTTALAAIQQWVSRGGGGGMSSGNGNQGLDAIVKSLGLTTDQFHKIATELGIEFSKGTDWIIQFQAALEMAIKSANRFSGSLGDQTALSQLRNKVYGKDSPADALTSTIALLNQFAPKLGAAFDGFDTTTEEGRQKIQTALQLLFEQLASGTLTPEDFGGLAGAKDLASIIETLQSSLTSLAKNASSAAAALLYVPPGYKVALARFNATAPGTGGLTGNEGPMPAPWRPPSHSDPRAPFSPIGSPLLSQVRGGTASDAPPILVVQGDVVITARELSPDDLFKSVLKAAQRRAQAQFGRSDQWARVQSAN